MKRCDEFIIRILQDSMTMLQFTDEQSAKSFLVLLLDRLPLLNTQYPQIKNNEVYLTNEQYCFYRRRVLQEKEEITTRYLEDTLLKTLRADEFDFSHAFILGIIPGENGTRRHQNLRPTARGQYTITPAGTVSLRHEKKSMYTHQEKKGFSQIQSSTLIDDLALTAAFGIRRDKRANKIYGLMTHIYDARINRALVNDGGTVARLFDWRYHGLAEAWRDSLQCYSPEQLREFKDANIKERQSHPSSQRTNEVLARLSFNPYRSVVCICADTLEARLLAYDFSQELLEHYAIYAENTGQKLNPHFKLPIIFYVPKTTKSDQPNEPKHDLRFYTDEMLRQDRVEALEIVQDKARRAEYYRKHNYEFLLGLPEITREILLDTCTGDPLAFAMLKAGYARMLLRLLRPTHAKSTLRDEVFDALIASPAHYFKRNDPIIAQLILVEAFDLADKLLLATQSKKDEVKYSHDGIIFSGKLLIDYLIKNGNPRQLHYMGLENMLVKAAEKGSWVTVKLCLKEYSVTDKSILDRLSHFAQHYNQHFERMFIVTRGLETASHGNLSIRQAADAQDWPKVALLIQNPKIIIDKSMYDYILIQAIIGKQEVLAHALLQAGADPTWRCDDSKYYLRGGLYYAVANDLITLLPLLIEYEKQCQDKYSQDRYLLALNLARHMRSEAIALLEKNLHTDAVIDPSNPEKCICRLVLQALSINCPDIAEMRLLRYCHQFQLLPENNNNIIDCLRIIMRNYTDTIKSMPFLNFDYIIGYLVEIFIRNEEISLFAFMVSSCPIINTGPSSIFIENLTYKILLSHLNPNNIALIKRISNNLCTFPVDKDTSYHKILWMNALSSAFKEAIENLPRDEDRAICLIELGVSLSGENLGVILTKAITTNAKKLAQYILDNSIIDGDDKKADLLNVLMVHAEHIETYYPLPGHDITPDLLNKYVLRNRHRSTNILIKLLQSIDQKQYCNNSYLWIFYRVFKFGFLSNDFQVQQQLMSMLSPSLIRHLMLIFVLERSCKMGVVESASTAVIRPNISRALASSCDPCSPFFPARGDDKFKGIHTKILDILESYFVDINQPPEDPIIKDTFTKILSIFESALKPPTFVLRLFGAKNSPHEARYHYMLKIDQELAIVEKPMQHKELLSELIPTKLYRRSEYFGFYLTALIALLVLSAALIYQSEYNTLEHRR